MFDSLLTNMCSLLFLLLLVFWLQVLGGVDVSDAASVKRMAEGTRCAQFAWLTVVTVVRFCACSIIINLCFCGVLM